MIAFDTDVLTELLSGNTKVVRRANAIAEEDQSVPVVVVEEILRGRLNSIRRAEAGQASLRVEQAYALFEESLKDIRHFRILSFSTEAQAIYRQWRKQKIRVSTHDLRIAAICVDRGATLISYNRRDFERVPGLRVEFWS